MNIVTREIVDPEEHRALKRKASRGDKEAILKLSQLREMKLPPTDKQMARTPPRIGLSDPCPCGSGRKFKKCCFMVPKDKRPSAEHEGEDRCLT